MDKGAYAVLKAGLDSRYGDLDRIAGRIGERRASFAETSEGVDSMAYQLHNLYGACEQLFEEVALAFENQIEGGRYHTDLLRRMKLEIEGIRPAFLSEDTAEFVDELRRFRHLFRHAYSMVLDPGKVADLAGRVPELRERFAQDVGAFLSKLSPASRAT